MNVEITDNSKEVSGAIHAALLRGLEKIGLVAEGYAKKLCPVDTGNLRFQSTRPVRGGTFLAFQSTGNRIEFPTDASASCIGQVNHILSDAFCQ